MTDHSDVISSPGSDWYFLSSVSVSLAPLFIFDLQIKMRFMSNRSSWVARFYLGPTWDLAGHKEEDAGFCCIYVCQDKWICQFQSHLL